MNKTNYVNALQKKDSLGQCCKCFHTHLRWFSGKVHLSVVYNAVVVALPAHDVPVGLRDALHSELSHLVHLELVAEVD